MEHTITPTWVNFGARPNFTKTTWDSALSVTLGAGAGPVANSPAYSVPANSNIEVRVYNDGAPKDMTLTIKHRTAADRTQAGYAPINIKVNETNLGAGYDVSVAHAGSREAFTDRFSIPAASWKRGYNTVRLTTQPGARTAYWIEWLALD